MVPILQIFCRLNTTLEEAKSMLIENISDIDTSFCIHLLANRN